MPSKDRDESSDLEDDSGDFLQDPELWVDRLPQPFRMINDLLQELLASAWEAVETREVQRQLQLARVQVPEVSDAHSIPHVKGVQAVRTGKGGLLFVGSTSGLSVYDVRGEEPDLLTQSNMAGTRGVHVRTCKMEGMELCIVAVTLDSGMAKIFAFTQNSLVALTELPNQDEDKQVVSADLAPTATHLALTVNIPDVGHQLEVYQLPVGVWHQELEKAMAATRAQEEVEGSQTSVGTQQSQEGHSKASLLMRICPPKPVSPCAISDPATALQRVIEDSTDTIATGECHILTQQYFESRRKAFISQRPDFAAESPICHNYEQSLPACHFLYYKNTCRQANPCYLAVWWKSHTQLLFYTLESSTKGAPAVPFRVFPQGSTISGSAVNRDSSLLAVGLQSGMVTMWNQKTGLCISTTAAVKTPHDRVSALEFIPGLGNSRSPALAVGTQRGRVLAIPVESNSHEPVVSVSHRVSKQKEVYGPIFQSSGYDCSSEVVSFRVNPALPGIITSLHANGCITVWSYSEREALCRLKLPLAFTVCKNLCTFSTEGDFAFIGGAAESEEELPGVTCLFSLSLKPVPHLKPHWGSKISSSNSDVACEDFERLAEFANTRHSELMQTQQKRRNKRWKEFWQELTLHRHIA